MNLTRSICLMALVAAIAGCGDGAQDDVLDDQGPVDSSVVRSDPPSGDSTPPRSDTAGEPTGGTAPRTVSPTRFGPVRIGMTLDELREAHGGEVRVGDTSGPCYHVRLENVVANPPYPLLAMIVDGTVARIEIVDSTVTTDEGARIGDTEARIRELYGASVRTEPHAYTDGHYLIVTPSDSTHRIVFETDGERVTRYRAGRHPEVGWVEGCS